MDTVWGFNYITLDYTMCTFSQFTTSQLYVNTTVIHYSILPYGQVRPPLIKNTHRKITIRYTKSLRNTVVYFVATREFRCRIECNIHNLISRNEFECSFAMLFNAHSVV